MQEIAQENPVRFAPAATNSSINAATAIVESIMCWIAHKSSRRKSQAHLIRIHLGLRSRSTRAAANKAAKDGEPTNLLPCMNNRASRFMSQICVRNLAAPEFRLMMIFTTSKILQMLFRPILYRSTRWLLRSIRQQARDLGTWRPSTPAPKRLSSLFLLALSPCGHGTTQKLATSHRLLSNPIRIA